MAHLNLKSSGNLHSGSLRSVDKQLKGKAYLRHAFERTPSLHLKLSTLNLCHQHFNSDSFTLQSWSLHSGERPTGPNGPAVPDLSLFHASQWSLGPRNWRNEFWCEKKIICVVFVVLLMCVRPAYALIFEFVKTIIMLWSASLWRVYASICEFVKTRYLLWFASLWRLYASISEFVKTICFD